ncbi:MAG: hypothetical protein JW915_06045 [Chitinispirillaceae bacterium]|nr:hypothetical protein [Chitinispirillaceae bacterium]
MKIEDALSAVIVVIILAGCSQINNDQILNGTDLSANRNFYSSENKNSILSPLNKSKILYQNYLGTIPPILTLIGNDTVVLPFGDPENKLEQLKNEYTVFDNLDLSPMVIVESDFSVQSFPK